MVLVFLLSFAVGVFVVVVPDGVSVVICDGSVVVVVRGGVVIVVVGGVYLGVDVVAPVVAGVVVVLYDVIVVVVVDDIDVGTMLLLLFRVSFFSQEFKELFINLFYTLM